VGVVSTTAAESSPVGVGVDDEHASRRSGSM